MSDPGTQRVNCPACRTRFRWRAELAGREVPCKQCDSRFIVPDQPGDGLAIEDADTHAGYELDLDGVSEEPTQQLAVPSNQGKCPSCNTKLREGAVLCMNCGFSLEAGGKLQTDIAAPAEPEEHLPTQEDEDTRFTKKQKREEERVRDTLAQHQWQDYLFPSLLAGVGILLALINLVLVPNSDMYALGMGSAGEERIGFAIWSTVNTIVSAILLFGGLLANVAIFGAAFGALGSVLLKVLAISLVCRQTDILFVMTMDMMFELGLVGNFISWGIYLALYIGLCMKLLELDAVEMRLVIGFVVVARIVGSFVITALIAALF